MVFDDPLDDRKADAQAFYFVLGIKGLEDMRQVVFRNTRPRIRNPDGHAFSPTVRAEVDPMKRIGLPLFILRTRRRVGDGVDGVVDEVQEHLAHLLGRSMDV